MDKDTLIKELQNKTNYTLGDCRNFLNAFINILHDTIEEREDFHIKGLGKLQYKITPEHEGNKPTKGVKGAKERILIPETESVYFTLSTDLRKIVKEPKEEI